MNARRLSHPATSCFFPVLPKDFLLAKRLSPIAADCGEAHTVEIEASQETNQVAERQRNLLEMYGQRTIQSAKHRGLRRL